MRDIHLSIVSHGQGGLVGTLLHDLAVLPSASRFQVTLIHNLPTPPGVLRTDCPFPVREIHNEAARGFAANQNHAFRCAPRPQERVFFAVLNPDLRISEDVFTPIAEALRADPHIGIAAPAVRAPDGRHEDSARILPTPMSLLRKFAGYRGTWPVDGPGGPFRPDWVAGMFMLFRAEVFAEIGGFDARFHLYYEDVDICSRLWLGGYSVVVDPALSIVHDAQRSSRKSLRYARWHIGSILRFFLSGVYRRARRFHRRRPH